MDISLEYTGAGIPVVTERISGTISSGFLVAVRTGSRDESKDIGGISHLLEHVAFRGTKKRTSLQISKEIEGAGGEMNAFTSKEMTAFYGITLKDTAEIAKELVADICVNPLISENDVELEKKIVLQEISMWVNDPDSYIHKLFAETLWDGHELSQNEAGEIDIVSKLNSGTLREYFDERYKQPNIAVIACGSVDPGNVMEWAERNFDQIGGGKKITRRPPVRTGSAYRLYPRKGDHTYTGMGFHAYPADHPDKAALRMLTAILGAGMSSRLFQSIREEKALVYSVFGTIDQNTDAGSMAAYMSSTENNVMNAINTAAAVMKDLRDNGLQKGELDRARNLLKGATARNMESTDRRMYRLTKSFMLTGKAEPFRKDLDALDRVTDDDVMRVANDIISSKKLNIAVYGKRTKELSKMTIDQIDL
ncbi:MAG: insulinase family protein [Methanomassiliicoccaceae archaeon]|jgi:predicted Zn-dependent peptidase|nr:insulinase family protein [Methanomassiliicoccaceae archaeon]